MKASLILVIHDEKIEIKVGNICVKINRESKNIK